MSYNEPVENAILKAKGIKKAFFGVPVLKDVDFEVMPGEIMGLIGENGAGKSTLMKIITGIYTLDAGEVFFEGKPVQLKSALDAADLGIAIVHQEFNLFSNLSVAENIFLNKKKYRNRFGIVNWKQMKSEAGHILRELGADMDVDIPVRLLSVREQQLVEIAKAISTNAKVVIMDEPSAALPDNEVQNMFQVVRTLRDKGVAIIYISHRMTEIEQICNRVTVLRDGKNVGLLSMQQTSIDKAITLMVGREIKDYYPHTRRSPGSEICKIQNISGNGIKHAGLSVCRGEIVGLYGLAGSGSTEFAEMVIGIRPMKSGSVTIGEHTYKRMHIKAAMANGIGYVPPDRKQEGVIVDMAVSDNVIMANYAQYEKRGLLDNARIASSVDKHIEELQIKCTGRGQAVKSLSGGNQQKVVLAKWLDRSPAVLIMNEPTRGVDVGAKSEIYRLIDELANKGLAILLISSEIPEVLGVCDRVLVMCRGKMSAEYKNNGNIGQDTLLKAASGNVGGIKSE